MPQEWTAKAGCVPNEERETRKMQEKIQKTIEATRRKVVRKGLGTQQQEKKVRQWAAENYVDGLTANVKDAQWRTCLESWLGRRRGAAKEEDIYELKGKLTNFVVTRIDRLPTQGLIE